MPHPPVRADGKIASTITHLEMSAPPSALPLPAPRDGLDIEQAVRPTVSFYRYLYDTIGEAWLWGDRRKLDDHALAAIVQHPAVEVYVLWVHGVPAGYAEFDGRIPGEIELAYFGLVPEFIGQKLGPYLLDWAIRTAWARDPRRLWVHTCSLDHPGALAMYERAGFGVFHRETVIEDDPRALGLIQPKPRAT
jgi:GNAT superfamily N-acetyltransferase